MAKPDARLKSRNDRRRTCNVCGGAFIAPVQDDRRRHNCLSTAGGTVGDLPSECWQKIEHPFARDLLASVPAYRQRSASDTSAHRTHLAITARVLDLSREGTITVDQVDELVRRYRRSAVRAFVNRLPGDSSLRVPLYDALDRLRQRDEASAMTKRTLKIRPPVELPQDFERGVELYIEKTYRIAEIKHRHGHRYSADTVRKRSQNARSFCGFLASQGLHRWPEVAQHHLDEYIDVTDRWAAARAYTFLQFIRQHFRLTQRFVRPKQRIKPPSEAVMPVKEIPAVLRRLIVSPDQQAIVGGLFLALFAQMPTRSAELTYGNFRRRNGRIEALFAEQWTPLDPLTAKHLQALVPDIGVDDPGRGTTRIFHYTGKSFARKVGKAVGVPLRPLRLGAVANLIRSGITDRGALHRILGVSMPTLAYVEKVFEWDLHMTVDPEMVKSRNEVIRGERTD